MIRKRLTLILLTISLIFALIAMPNSAAVTIKSLNRDTKAIVSNDNNAVLKLEGFDSSQYIKLSNSYNKVGSITNNSNQSINLNVVMTPTQMFGIIGAYQLGVKMGSASCIIRSNTTSQQLAISLMPGQTIDLQMNITNSLLDFISTSFTISASDSTKTYNISLPDTTSTPRRILTY